LLSSESAAGWDCNTNPYLSTCYLGAAVRYVRQKHAKRSNPGQTSN